MDKDKYLLQKYDERNFGIFDIEQDKFIQKGSLKDMQNRLKELKNDETENKENNEGEEVMGTKFEGYSKRLNESKTDVAVEAIKSYFDGDVQLMLDNTENTMQGKYNNRRPAHSVAYDALVLALNARAESELTSKQIQAGFKKLGLDYKELLKPVVDYVEQERKENKNESKLNETLNFKKYGIVRATENDFSDDGSRFRGYICNGVPISYLKSNGTVYLDIKLDYFNGLTYDEYSKLPSYKDCDKYNGVDESEVDLQDVVDICKRIKSEYEEAVVNIKEVTDDEFKKVTDTYYNKAKEDYEGCVNSVNRVGANNLLNLSEYDIKYLKDYLKSLKYNMDRWAWDKSKNVNQARRRDLSTEKSKEYYTQTSWYVEQIEEILSKLGEVNENYSFLRESKESDVREIMEIVKEPLDETKKVDEAKATVTSDDEDYRVTEFSFGEDDIEFIKQLLGSAFEVSANEDNSSTVNIQLAHTEYINGGSVNLTDAFVRQVIDHIKESQPNIKFDTINRNTTIMLLPNIEKKLSKEESKEVETEGLFDVPEKVRQDSREKGLCESVDDNIIDYSEIDTFEGLEELVEDLYSEGTIDDDEYDKAMDMIQEQQESTETYIQRRSEVTNTDPEDEMGIIEENTQDVAKRINKMLKELRNKEDLNEACKKKEEASTEDESEEKTLLDYLQDRIDQEMTAGELNTILQSLFAKFNHTFITYDDIFNADWDEIQELYVIDDDDTYTIRYKIKDAMEGIVTIEDVILE